MQLIAEWGHDIDRLIEGDGLCASALEHTDARVSTNQYGTIAHADMSLCEDDGLGYALALRTPPTAHGSLGSPC